MRLIWVPIRGVRRAQRGFVNPIERGPVTSLKQPTWLRLVLRDRPLIFGHSSGVPYPHATLQATVTPRPLCPKPRWKPHCHAQTIDQYRLSQISTIPNIDNPYADHPYADKGYGAFYTHGYGVA
jgi:hypothetical protein